jgi:hypothetical protein
VTDDDEANDPEYNIMDEPDEDDEEEVRNDKATRISSTYLTCPTSGYSVKYLTYSTSGYSIKSYRQCFLSSAVL